MVELIKKHTALRIPTAYVMLVHDLVKNKIMGITEEQRDEMYKDFKATTFCIGLEPEEYETVIKWFCDTMEY